MNSLPVIQGWDYTELAKKWGVEYGDYTIEDDWMSLTAIKDKIKYSSQEEHDELIADMVEFLQKLSENEDIFAYSRMWEALIEIASDESDQYHYVFVQFFLALMHLMWT